MKKIIFFLSLGFLFLNQISFVTSTYPPCLNCDCTGNRCKKPGDKVPYEWPELVGIEIMKAKVIIESSNPNCIHITNVCCNRVWLCPDEKGFVKDTPIVG
ncbi:unnamed protein product [Withania somnifera]